MDQSNLIRALENVALWAGMLIQAHPGSDAWLHAETTLIDALERLDDVKEGVN